MQCKECGIEGVEMHNVKVVCTMHLENGTEVVRAEFRKTLCDKCLAGNAYGLKHELLYLQEDDNEPDDNLLLRINEDIVKESALL